MDALIGIDPLIVIIPHSAVAKGLIRLCLDIDRNRLRRCLAQQNQVTIPMFAGEIVQLDDAFGLGSQELNGEADCLPEVAATLPEHRQIVLGTMLWRVL